MFLARAAETEEEIKSRREQVAKTMVMTRVQERLEQISEVNHNNSNHVRLYESIVFENLDSKTEISINNIQRSIFDPIEDSMAYITDITSSLQSDEAPQDGERIFGEVEEGENFTTCNYYSALIFKPFLKYKNTTGELTWKSICFMGGK